MKIFKYIPSSLMRKPAITISEDGHRNPSLTKIRRATSLLGSKTLKENPLPLRFNERTQISFIKIGERSKIEKLFLGRCLEQVSNQNSVLNEQIHKKQKQYRYLSRECERMRKLMGRGVSTKIKNSEQNGWNLLVNGKEYQYKESLSSIESEGQSKQSLMSEKLIPVDINDISMENLEWENSSKLYLKQLTKELKLQLEKIRVDKIKQR